MSSAAARSLYIIKGFFYCKTHFSFQIVFDFLFLKMKMDFGKKFSIEFKKIERLIAYFRYWRSTSMHVLCMHVLCTSIAFNMH